MAKSQKEKAREGIANYKKLKAEAAKKRKPDNKRPSRANWAEKLRASVKSEMKKRKDKKVSGKKDTYITRRTSHIMSALKKAGVSDKKISRMRGGK